MRLCAQNLTLERGGRRLFENVCFELHKGTLTRLTGPNGAGKTSLLRVIAGLGELTQGTISLEGSDAELGIGAQAHFVAHQEAVKPALTARENLEFWQGFLGGGSVEAALDAFALGPLADLPAAWASAGQKRRMALARLALAFRPLWLLDEPTVGLDTASEACLTRLMQAHLQKGGIILAATHVPLQVEATQEIRLESAS
ncbi:MAG: heme ABC exporter ATP-binding protein CcmA [Aestuariivirgaceae bacterium]|nr:heme ABC exporter ATP-binding protein CcmA [Aestuariivirgaceae bacterium]